MVEGNVIDSSMYLHISVEGSWSQWGSWGTCTGTCDSDAERERIRNYTGGIEPCSGSRITRQSCMSMCMLLKR